MIKPHNNTFFSEQNNNGKLPLYNFANGSIAAEVPHPMFMCFLLGR